MSNRNVSLSSARWLLFWIWIIGIIPPALYSVGQRIMYDDGQDPAIATRFLVISLLLLPLFGLLLGSMLGNFKQEKIGRMRVALAICSSLIYLSSVWFCFALERVIDKSLLDIIGKADVMISVFQAAAAGCVTAMLTGGVKEGD